jgi:transcriptional regulator with XRE-family HTH domain
VGVETVIVGQRLRELRKRQKISAEELGNVLGMSQQQVLRYETNKTDLTTDTLIKIADYFDVSTDYLLGRADSTIPYERKGPLVWNFELTQLLRFLSPERVGRLLKASGFDVRIIGLSGTDKRQLCVEIPEKHDHAEMSDSSEN